MTDSTNEPAYMAQHREAVANGEKHYIDAQSGLVVWTELYLKQRPCCQSACRHCPYGFKQKPNYF